jgi:hypothetical protein
MSISVLPSMEHTFTIKVKGSETAQVFDGTFRYKRPNIRLRSEIDKTKAILDGGLLNLDENTQLLHGVLARLKHTIIESPDWWKKSDYGYELFDLNVILEISKECNKFDNEWMDKVWAEPKTEEAKEVKTESKK